MFGSVSELDDAPPERGEHCGFQRPPVLGGGLLAGEIMNKLGASLIGSLLFAGALALTGCAEKTTTGSGTCGVLASCFGGTTTGTGVGPTGQVVLIRVGTDNLISSDPPLYRKIWVAIVTDTAGRAVSGATVIFALRSGTAANPGGFLKGKFVLPPPAAVPQQWQRQTSAICANEDANFNAIQVVLIRVGTDNLITSDPPLYRKIWVAIVTDTAGRAVSGATDPYLPVKRR